MKHPLIKQGLVLVFASTVLATHTTMASPEAGTKTATDKASQASAEAGSAEASSKDANAGSSADFEKGFGTSSGISESEKSSADDDRLKIGGSLASDSYASKANNTDYLLNPLTLWLYLDAKLRHGIRGLVKVRGVVDATGNLSQGLGKYIPASNSDVEEMKLMFNAEDTAFFTLGKQKIKWGAGKFWNPTDVINSVPRNLLYSDDRRSGVSILKTHVPLGKSNLYLVNSFAGAARVKEIGNTLRYELPLKSSELSFTASKPNGRDAILGADLSAAIWKFDIHAEAAYSKSPNPVYSVDIPAFRPHQDLSYVAGATYEMPFLDSDEIDFIVEYFHNGDGFTDKNNYINAFANNAYVPFYLAQQYAMFMVYAMNPGSWNHTTLSLFNVLNITDHSALTKFNVGFTLMQDLLLELGATFHYGNSQGEFRVGNQIFDVNARVKIDF